MSEGTAAGRRAGPRILVAPALLAAVVLLSFAAGKFPVAPGELFAVVAAKLAGAEPAVDPAVTTVVWDVRLPRVLAGLLVGAALAAAGAAYQGMFRNALVSPDILGVSSGAGLCAVLGIYLGLPVVGIQGLAFVGGLAAVGAVIFIAGRVRNHDPVLVMVLAGVAVGTLLGAGISLIKVLSDPYTQLPAITYWLLGSLAAVTRADLASTLPAIVLGVVPLVLLRWRMNLLGLPEDEARALGVDTRRLRLVLIAAATLMTAAAVSITGVIGWVGLVTPHVARLLVGPDFSRLLPASLMLGGGFLVGADALARTIAPVEVPLGILTALVGAPFFLWLLATARRGW